MQILSGIKGWQHLPHVLINDIFFYFFSQPLIFIINLVHNTGCH